MLGGVSTPLLIVLVIVLVLDTSGREELESLDVLRSQLLTVCSASIHARTKFENDDVRGELLTPTTLYA